MPMRGCSTPPPPHLAASSMLSARSSPFALQAVPPTRLRRAYSASFAVGVPLAGGGRGGCDDRPLTLDSPTLPSGFAHTATFLAGGALELGGMPLDCVGGIKRLGQAAAKPAAGPRRRASSASAVLSGSAR